MRSLGAAGLAAAACVAVIAGFVDAIAYVSLGGYFVSFMSGNTTRAAVDAVGGGVWTAPLLILAFVLGVVVASAAGGRLGRHRSSVALGVVTTLLVAASVGGAAGAPTLVTHGLVAASMGAVNTLFARNGETSFGLTYMTGALVKLGQGVVAAFSGGSKTAWLRYLLMWGSIVGGAFAGVTSFGAIGLAALWVAVAATALLLGASILRRPGPAQHSS